MSEPTLLPGKPLIAGPADLAWWGRDRLLPRVREGMKPVSEDFLPRIMQDAARILRVYAGYADAPAQVDDQWIAYWLPKANDTYRNADPESAIGHAASALLAAAELRQQLENGNTEAVATLTIIVVGEMLQATHYPLMEEAFRVRSSAERHGIGKLNAEYGQLESETVKAAERIWRDDPGKRIGEVVSDIQCRILAAAKQYDIPLPADDTVRGWIKEAGRNGRLNIPAAATKGGRPRKK